jgi:lysozyme family protein
MSELGRSLNFVKAIEFTLPWETGTEIVRGKRQLRADGGLHYRDKGLPTKYGIWKHANPDVDVENLTLDKAIEIYQRKYWRVYTLQKPLYLDLDSMGIVGAVALFDCGVNLGVGRANGFMIQVVKEKDESKWAKLINEMRMAHYVKLRSQPEYAPNYNGWMNRLNDLSKYVDVLQQAPF